MRSIILGLGVAAFTAVAVATIVANAAVGDAIYAKRDNDRYALPVGAKRTAVVNLITACYPALTINTFKTLRCSRLAPAAAGLLSVSPSWRCHGEQFYAAVTDAARLDLVLAGKAEDIRLTDAAVALDACEPATATVDSVTENVFTRDEGAVGEFMCERGTPGGPSCTEVFITNGTPAQWGTDLKAGLVVGTIGKVQ